jgi:WD40 repeat protein
MLAVSQENKGGNDSIAVYNAFSDASGPIALYHVADTPGSQIGYPAIAWSPIANSFATPSYSDGQQQQIVEIWQVGKTSSPARILTSDSNGTPRTIIYDTVKPTTTSSANIDVVAWSADGKSLAGHTSFGSVIIWDVTTGNVKGALSLPMRPFANALKISGTNMGQIDNECLAWSPAMSSLLAISNIDQIMLWDTQTSKLLLTMRSKDPVYFQTGLTWSSNGKYLAASFAGSGNVAAWDIQAAMAGAPSNAPQGPLLTFGIQIHKDSITAIDWSPNGRYIVSGSADKTAVVWKVGG